VLFQKGAGDLLFPSTSCGNIWAWTPREWDRYTHPAPLFGEIYRREGVGRLVVRLQKRNDRIYFVLAGLDLLWIAEWWN
jgi:hypothetical protein